MEKINNQNHISDDLMERLRSFGDGNEQKLTSRKRPTKLSNALMSELDYDEEFNASGVSVNNYLSSRASALQTESTKKKTIVSLTNDNTKKIETPNNTPVDANHFSVNEVLNNRYQVEDIIGEGGFGIVYKARDLKTGEIIAVKTLRRTIPEYDIARKRFQREISIAQKLSGKHTIKIIDHGISSAGIMFFCMEFLQGEELESRITDGKLFTFVETYEIATQTLESLAEAHQAGVVHRDLKPSNIFLRQTQDKSFDVCVLDFGIAKISNELEENSKLTKTGASFGTPAYMSPEQVRGASIVTGASDVYAIGLIMLEMLTNCSVVQGNSAFEVALQQLSIEPVVVPFWIANSPMGAVITKAVARDPEVRYANGAEMLDALKAIQRSDLLEGYAEAKKNHFPTNDPKAVSSKKVQNTPENTESNTQDDNKNKSKNLQNIILIISIVLLACAVLGIALYFLLVAK